MAINEKDWLFITQGLKKQKSDGSLVIDGLMRSGVCPFCGTEKWVEPDGAETPPLIVDKETLSFKTKCCSSQGGPCNFIMMTRKMTVDNAIKFLKDFVK